MLAAEFRFPLKRQKKSSNRRQTVRLA